MLKNDSVKSEDVAQGQNVYSTNVKPQVSPHEKRKQIKLQCEHCNPIICFYFTFLNMPLFIITNI